MLGNCLTTFQMEGDFQSLAYFGFINRSLHQQEQFAFDISGLITVKTGKAVHYIIQRMDIQGFLQG